MYEVWYGVVNAERRGVQVPADLNVVSRHQTNGCFILLVEHLPLQRRAQQEHEIIYSTQKCKNYSKSTIIKQLKIVNKSTCHFMYRSQLLLMFQKAHTSINTVILTLMITPAGQNRKCLLRLNNTFVRAKICPILSLFSEIRTNSKCFYYYTLITLNLIGSCVLLSYAVICHISPRYTKPMRFENLLKCHI